MAPVVADAYNALFIVALIVIACGFLAVLIRVIIGPRVADRIVAVNMLGTLVIAAIAVLSCLLDESYLLDVCLIYAMLSFLAVIVLTKIYTGVYTERKKRAAKPAEEPQKEDSRDRS